VPFGHRVRAKNEDAIIVSGFAGSWMLL
jgi:hypothetical protein